MEGGTACSGIARDRAIGRGEGGVEERVLLGVAGDAGLALNPSEIASRVDDHRRCFAADPDGGDIIQGLEPDPRVERDLRLGGVLLFEVIRDGALDSRL